MQIFRIQSENDLKNLDSKAEIFSHGCVLALGFFDGVHKAHRKLINEARSASMELNIPLVIFTFSSKSSSLKPYQKRLLTDSEKLTELNSLGTDATLIFDFDLIKNIEADAFVREILVNKLNTHTAFCGFNFRFGKNAAGNTSVLENKMRELGRNTVIVPELKENGVEISSSAIRALLEEKKLYSAARLLGKPFFADGKVLHGLGLGKKLGFPTVNLDFGEEKLALQNGVYFTAVKFDGKIYPAITNFGVCPTFDERGVHAETFIFNFSKDLYNADIRLYFIEFLRDEIKFSSQNDLIMQINVDKNRALQLSKEIKWQEIGLNLP